MRARNWTRVVTGFALGVALAVSVLPMPSAQADTVPPVANDPTNPETVSAKPLPTVQIDGVVWSQKVVGDTVYVAGEFGTARPAGAAAGVGTVTRNNLLAYNINTGALIDTWVANTNGAARVVTASPDGKRIYVGGSFTTVTGSNGVAVTRRRIVSLDPVTGAVQDGFNPNPDATVNAIAATNSTVYFGGVFGTAGGASRSRLAAWTPATTGAGTLVSWAPSAAGGAVKAMTFTPDGKKLVVGGQFTTVNGSGNPGYGMAAVDPTSGALVPWAANATVRDAGANAGINSLTADEDSVYASGFVFGAGGNLEGSTRINNDGTVNWVEDCHGDTYSLFPRNGVVYKASHDHYCGNVPGGFSQPETWRFYRGLAVTKKATGVLRTEYLGYANWAGTPSPSILQWYPQLDAGSYTGQTQAAWSLTGNDNYVLAGGEFPKVDGLAQQGLVRYAMKSVAGDTEAPEQTFGKFVPTVTSPGSGQALISWQTNYDRDSRNLTYRVYRNGVEIPGSSQTAGSNLWDRPYLNFLDSGQTPGTTVSYRVSAFDPAGNEARSNTVSVTIAGTGTGPDAYSQAVLKDGPQSYWRLDESSGTTMADYTGLDPMTAQAGVTRSSTGAISGRGSATFNGSSSQTAASGTLQEGPWWFSVEGWFKTSSATATGRIVGFSGNQTGSSPSGKFDRAVYMSSGGKLNFGAKQGSNRVVTTSGSYNDNKWHHVVGVIGDSGTNLYVDGTLVGSRQDLRTAGSYSGYWRIGGDTLNGWTNDPSNDYFNGSIDDVAVYEQALTGNQVRAHYLAAGNTSAVPTDTYGKAVYDSDPSMYWRFGETSGTTAADSSLNGQTGTYAGSPTFGGASAVNVASDKSITLNGTNGNVASNNTSLTSPPVYSEEAWFKTNTTTGGQIIGFGSSKSGSSTTYDRQVYMTNSGTLKFAVSPSNVDTSIETPSAYNDNAWHHVVATQGASGMKLYVDGVAVASGATVNSLSYNGYWRVGGDSLTGRSSKPTSSYFKGAIDEVAVYSRVLGASEVQAHFTKGGGTTPNQNPVADFSSTKDLLDVAFDASASTDADGTIASYAWDFGDTTTGSGKTPSHTYSAAGTYSVKLTVTDNSGGTNSVTKSVTVQANQAPTADFSATPTNNSAAFDASASADSDGTIASYTWDFGDGQSGSGKTPTHVYASGNTYTVTLTVTDDRGATGTTTKSVTVTDPPANQSPTAAFTSTSAGLNASFDSSGTGDPDGSVASYDWDFGDSTAHGTTANPNHAYGAPGTYTVTLTVTDNQGATGTVSHDVAVSGPIAADDFTRTSASGWGTATTGGDWTVTSSGGAASNYPVSGGVGQMKGATSSTVTREIVLNGVSGADTDTQIKAAVDRLPASGGAELVMVGARQQSGGGSYQLRTRISDAGAVTLTLYCQKVPGGTCVKSTIATATPGLTVAANQQLNIRLQVQGNGTTTLRAKVWAVGTAEPTDWQVTGTDTTAALQAPGGVFLSTYTSGTAGAIVTSWDDLLVNLL